MTAPPSAAEIVRAAGSNLAFALAVLPRSIRADMRVFYAFCRQVDDIVDGIEAAESEKRAALERWRQIVRREEESLDPAPRPGLEQEMTELCRRRQLPAIHLEEIIDGVAMDLDRNRYATIEELLRYCHGVASAVGLVSIEIFGCRDPGSRVYAVKLGYALQLTNILRDVGEDASEGRIYLPREDLEQFGIEEEGILEWKHDEAFTRLMAFECERAEAFYAEAVAALPEIDRRSLRSAELMREIYSRILARMKADGFRVFEKRYRLPKLEMIGCLGRSIFG